MSREFAEWLELYRIAKARGLSRAAASDWADRDFIRRDGKRSGAKHRPSPHIARGAITSKAVVIQEAEIGWPRYVGADHIGI
jgi:hypothetical protein